jgi:hypothetical protein
MQRGSFDEQDFPLPAFVADQQQGLFPASSTICDTNRKSYDLHLGQVTANCFGTIVQVWLKLRAQN